MALKKVEAIKRYFESDPHGRKVTMDELKALSTEERQELAEMAATAMGDTLAAAA
jgi:hypothetical protein